MKILLIVFALLGCVLISRLVGLQIGQTENYQKTAFAPERISLKPIPANRGRILARGPGGEGSVELVANEPCFEAAVYYPVMDPDEWWIGKEHGLIRKKMIAESKNSKLQVPGEELAFRLQHEIDQFWRMLSEATNVPLEELLGRRDRIVGVIQKRIARVHEKQEYVDYPISEQRMFYPIVADLDERQALELRGKLAETPWVVVRPSVRRLYKQKDTLCHLLGRTLLIPGSPSKTFQKTDDDDCLPGELQGMDGLELVFDKQLRGTRGWVKLDKEQTIETSPQDGRDITLTIDIALQEYAQKRLKQQIDNISYAIGGAAVVIDVQKSELLALVSLPTFNPSEFKEKFSQLRTDHKYSPLINRAFERFPPGSIVKPIVGAWAVEHGKVSPFTTFNCEGFLSANLSSFKCWQAPPGHGLMDFASALANSCDVYFYHVGELLTAEGLADLYRHIGFGQPVPLGGSEFNFSGLPNNAGRVPSQEWFIRHHNRGMSEGDARNLAIGQGDLEITPLQAALMVGEIITGKYQPPKILTDEPVPPSSPVGIGAYARSFARKGMFNVVNEVGATGYKDAYTERIPLAAKTGSATVQPKPIEWEVSYHDPVSGELIKKNVTDLEQFYKTAPVPKKQIDYRAIAYFPTLREEDQKDPYGRAKHLAHGWFTGYAPANRPRIVTVVFIEYGMAGGSGAGPVFRDIMLKCQELGYIK